MELTPRQIAGFWAKVDRSGGPEACWLWTGWTDQDGYGMSSFGSKGNVLRYRAHRMAFTLTSGGPPAGTSVLHRCDTPPCCNPAHLYLGTAQDNVRDRQERDRQARGARLARAQAPHRPRGERVNTNRLIASQVREIRQRFAGGERNCAALGRAYGVTGAQVRNIVLRRQWKHLD